MFILILTYLYLKLECFTYLCMSFYIMMALDFVSQQHFSILSLLPLCMVYDFTQ